MWHVKFTTKECDSISVNVDNEYWHTWNSSDGNVDVALAPKWANKDCIKVYAAVKPEGKNGYLEVWWDDENKQTFDFDDDEDHDVCH